MICEIKNRDDLIADYLSGDMPEEEMRDFEEHYFQCELCFKELKSSEAAVRLIKQEGRSLLEKNRSSNLKPGFSIIERFLGLSTPKRWAIALSTAAIIFLLIIFNIKYGESIDSEIIITEDKQVDEQIDESIEPIPEVIQPKDDFTVLTGPAFEQSQYIEDWINENIRSSNEKIDTVLSPVLGDTIKNNNVIFSWRMVEQEEVSIKIMNNLEEEIYKAVADPLQFPDYNVKVSPKTFNPSGLYYWRIEDENEVLYIGKFYFLQ
ncbi:MAG: zf-HC2 domain-containing protein [Ignavibacteriaceae bacterium]